MSQKYDFGMIGLGVMGSNLLYNIADHGFSVIGFDLSSEKAKNLEKGATEGTKVKGVTAIEEFVSQLSVPRKIMLLVPAGKPVDAVIDNLIPHLEKGDIIIDGGNSHYVDTVRRVKYVSEKGFHFMGMGVSGGEEGARKGPSIMPGGDVEAFKVVQPILEAVAAKVNGEACTAYMGKDAAGHYVKMVHNGIEYAIMQLISEVYDLMHRGLGLSNEEMHQIFHQWNQEELNSFLIEITADIFKQKDVETGKELLDVILDKAGAKGTGKWTSQDAMDRGVSIPTIDIAVSLRTLSAYKEQRINASKIYNKTYSSLETDSSKFINELKEALFCAIIISYAQGLSLLVKASEELTMEIPLKDVVKIWRGGCIIRSTLLETFYEAYSAKTDLENILLDENIASLLISRIDSLREVVSAAAKSSIPAGALQTALAYFDAYTSERMSTNMIQAQRDTPSAHDQTDAVDLAWFLQV
jgi:6-phosphogluconate dehydrogenase